MIAKRDLSVEEFEDYKILANQLADGRPARDLFPLSEKFIKLWAAYERKCKQLKEANRKEVV